MTVVSHFPMEASLIKGAIRGAIEGLGYTIKKSGSGDERSPSLPHVREYIRARIKGAADPLEADFIRLAANHLLESEAQLFQDAFVLSALGEKTGGFFVEFGAASGIDLSNSYMLERDFGWHGILAEPGLKWQPELKANRPRAIHDHRCVWTRSGERMNFVESALGEYSTLDEFANSDHHAEKRVDGAVAYEVTTVSLLDLLNEHQAPEIVDYLSIDTEGSEFAILNSFPFGKRAFRTITVEHNHTSQRQEIYDLLTGKGYRRVLEGWSEWDDWYVLDA